MHQKNTVHQHEESTAPQDSIATKDSAEQHVERNASQKSIAIQQDNAALGESTACQYAPHESIAPKGSTRPQYYLEGQSSNHHRLW